MPTDAQTGATLLPIARAAIALALGRARSAQQDAPWLQDPGATFVTLTQRGQLRGCIGSLQPHRPLRDDVQANAVAAALRDPRFAPLRIDELEHTLISVSLLSPMETMQFDDEADALAQLRPGIDGVVFAYGSQRSTFLPQVWEQLPTVELFMDQLRRKAGLPGDFWADGVRLQRYAVAKWEEDEATGAGDADVPAPRAGGQA